MTPEMIAMYWTALGSHNPRYLEQAVKDHIADPIEGKWFPKPAHLIGHIEKYKAKDKSMQELLNPPKREKYKEPTSEQKEKIKGMIEEMKRGL